jgi:hypothetical protein
MSKARRIKARRQRSQQAQPGRPRVIRTVEDLDAAGAEFTTDMPCRVTYLTDPVLGEMQPAAGIGPHGNLVADDSGTVEPIPAVLFEPARVVMLSNPGTGMVQEAKTEGIVAAGFHRVPGHPVWAIEPAPGWEVRRMPGQLILRDGSGEIWAAGKVTPEPAWVSAAASYRQVVVFYGPRLGVRTPPGMNAASYTTAKRAAEFRQSRGQGLVTAATVTWCGEATDETLEWMTFLPGSFGQPLPGVFAPVMNFTRHGGPEAFGLGRLRDHGLGVPADPIKTLIARVSHTDIDLIDPAETAAFADIGGVHYSEGIDAAWRQAVLSHGILLLLTGRSLPSQPGPDPHRSLEALGELWAAVVRIRAA